jgi:thiamine pyrophosphokinase
VSYASDEDTGDPAPRSALGPVVSPPDGRALRAVIVAGSTLDSPLDARTLAAADLLVAADAGAQALLDLGLSPHLVVGDMDSVRVETLAALRRSGVEVVQLRPDKDETDLEVALQLAVERGAGAITVFGALGGPRLDHLLASVLLLTAPYLRGRDVRLVDGRHRMFLAHRDVAFEGAPGNLVTLLPLTSVVLDVWTEGLRYRLRGEPLRQSAARGVSNEFEGVAARVRHAVGELLVIHYHEERAGDE